MAAFDNTRMGTPPLGRSRRTAPTRELARLGPVEQLNAGRLVRRLTQLAVGLVLYGLTLAMIIRAGIGNAPWDVLHQGMARHLPITIGTAVIVMSLVVLLLWIPLRELPGLGTIANSFVIGLSTDFFLGVVNRPEGPEVQVLLMLAGVLLNGVATALYLGSQLGPGPRDGLMTGLHRRTGISIRAVRTTLEVTVVVLGFVLGGIVGVGTLVYTLAIGPLVQVMLPYAIVDLPERALRSASSTSRSSSLRRPEPVEGSRRREAGADLEPAC